MDRPSWKLSKEQKDDIARRYGAREKVEALAAEFSVGNGTIINIARVRGYPPRRVKAA